MPNFSTLREQFLALNQAVHGQGLVYLDTAATALKPKVVVDRVTKFYSDETSNVHRGAHYLSDRATEQFELARNKVAKFLNANSEKEIVFTSGTTDGINLVASSFGAKFIKQGDEILLTQMEHHSNIVPWQLLADKVGAKIKWAPVTESGELDLEKLASLITTRTKLVAVTQCSNVLGTVNNVKAIVDIAKPVGAKVLIDAAQSVTFMPIDVQNLGCDFLVFSGHKLYGPFGVGVLYGQLELLEAMPPYRGGGSMISQVTEAGATFLNAPHKFEAGTPNISGVIGLGSAIDFVTEIGLENIRKHDIELLKHTEASLLKMPLLNTKSIKIRLVGQSASRVNLLSFIVDGVHAADIGQLLDQQGVAVRVGHHCAQPLMKRFGITGTVRVSLGVYNSQEDVDKFVRSLEKSLEILL